MDAAQDASSNAAASACAEVARESAGVAESRASLVHSLSARTAQLSHTNTQLREERDYLQVPC